MLLKVPTLIISPNIGKYAAEKGPAKATRHFSVPEMMAKRFGQICQVYNTANNFLGKSAKFCTHQSFLLYSISHIVSMPVLG